MVSCDNNNNNNNFVSHFIVSFDFRSAKIRGYFFNEIVRVASSPKVRFEVDDVVIE